MKFFDFWFRFIFKYDHMVQMKSFEMLRKLVKRDYPIFSGFALESYFRARFAESGKWTRLGNWWDRKGENELDIIAENELDGRLLVAEVKRDKRRIDLDAVRGKYEAFEKVVGKRYGKPQFKALSIEDM